LGATPIDNFGAIPGAIPQTRDATGRLARARKAAVTLGETLRLAMDALHSHKLRSFLTLLGVILAVTALITVMSAVVGLNTYVADRVANLGANVFLVHRFGIITSYDAWIKAQKRPLVTLEEFERLRDNMQTAKNVAGEEDRNSVQTKSGDQILDGTNVQGVTPNFADVRNLTVAQGRFLTQADEDHHSEVVFIGADLAKKFFPNVDPVGRMIRAETHSYQVIGVAEAIGTAFGQSQDNFMMMPLTTYRKGWHRQSDWVTVFVQSPNAEMMPVTEDEARMLMRAWRHLPFAAPDNFAILGSDSIMSLWHQLMGNIEFMAMALVSVFLVVGGIVIMNIMLASVTERTREIGIRRSLGARKNHILLQFMAESAVLAAAGGLIGIGLAYGVVWLVKVTISFPMTTPISAVVISMLLATAVGLFFGIYPAMRAAKLDPIEALRAES